MTPAPTGEPWMAEPSSTLDPVGRVFHRGGRVFRAIRPEYEADVRLVVALAQRHGWFEAGLIETTVTEETIEGYALVVEHRRAPFVTYRAEWPAEALRDAALCYVRVARSLLASGWGLKDSHPWNVLFIGSEPRVSDVGSVRPLGEIDWAHWWSEFLVYFLAPLVLFAEGDTEQARRLTREHVRGVGTWFLENRREVLLRPDAIGRGDFSDPARALEELERQIEELAFPHQGSEWTAYPQPLPTSPESLRLKDRIVADYLARATPATVLDLGTNRGLHAGMAVARGADVLAADIDEGCLDDVHRRALQARASLHAVYLDLVWPQGSGGAFGTMPSAQERLRCDAVLCMAVMHHVCVRQQFSPEAFIDGVTAFSGRDLVLEFVPHDDVHVAQWPQRPPAGYAADAVQASLLARFRRVVRVASEPEPRIVFICEGRRG